MSVRFNKVYSRENKSSAGHRLPLVPVLSNVFSAHAATARLIFREKNEKSVDYCVHSRERLTLTHSQVATVRLKNCEGKRKD